MMIFASDLDKTLIYSKKSMRETLSEDELVPVEENGGTFTSFMTQSALSWLTLITQVASFIPVTTRTISQYRRVFQFSKNVNVKYAVTSNGGNILVDGEPDQEWCEHVRLAVESSASREEIKMMYDEISSPEWALRGWLCDDLFYTMIIDPDKTPLEILEQFRSKLLAQGWVLSIQGRKVYLVPERITKGDALLYLKERIGATYIAASGDSLLDESLLKVANYAISPRHGELYALYGDSHHYRFTESSGIRASEELLKWVHRGFLEHKSQLISSR
ncbi:hydroxymethylpyrimidine pyrophosphatase-like HAD family hydrolase [Fontibacillus solani]|uniref:Hydroxymethylpyrimidine pyrophosphatase-like HAD family hydrolase n=1 Tax=Fontibacillus solani TaxID=1572857 RepID=A0A7W3SU24_9BACL|nr:HAD family hydrolase [Fontibacillus solani]MBA9086247.1 hydroxymethylpyrimidine pyrophosphatase-like HAD family hydrolase [Fontibacillus solani]